MKIYSFFLAALDKRNIIPAKHNKKIPVPIGEPQPKTNMILPIVSPPSSVFYLNYYD